MYILECKFIHTATAEDIKTKKLFSLSIHYNLFELFIQFILGLYLPYLLRISHIDLAIVLNVKHELFLHLESS